MRCIQLQCKFIQINVFKLVTTIDSAWCLLFILKTIPTLGQSFNLCN